ncbi:MAG TPA: polysaccharide deacetylase family protein [Bryobacteraceae bacterium]|nr:polysaccharide deacetylase family protein [Bryobacteraceae bacterium]HPT24813.1 polysaccharide deacetylase family protein [Bryobacteraceae bacterium]
MVVETLAVVCLAGGILAWGARGKSSRMFAPSVWRGPKSRRAIALTFDDGPSESTRELLDVLDEFGIKATFFQCGFHARRLRSAAAEVARRGHEIGNHGDTHQALYLHSAGFILGQLERAQISIQEATGTVPRLFRPPFGVRWPGLAAAQHKLGLTGVMWTAIARDWMLTADQIVARMSNTARPGAILCFHDGRELAMRPDIKPTIEAIRRLVPVWIEQGYEFLTVSELTGQQPG